MNPSVDTDTGVREEGRHRGSMEHTLSVMESPRQAGDRVSGAMNPDPDRLSCDDSKFELD